MEIWFPSQEEVTVFAETTFADREGLEAAMLMFFSYFAARTAANLSGSPAQAPLGYSLMKFRVGGTNVANELLAANDVSRTTPTTRAGRKGFRATLHPFKDRNFFKYKPQGFGMLGKGVDFYAPMAVFAFASYLVDHYGANAQFADALCNVAAGIGEPTAIGELGVLNQHEYALRALGGH